MNKTKYLKPVSNSLDSINGAEGACIGTGVGVYGTSCEPGTSTLSCNSTGTSASFHNRPQLCNVSGTSAGVCYLNGNAAQ
jgi:hypothetical protein